MTYKYSKSDKTKTASLIVTGVVLVGLLWFFFISPGLTGLSILTKATEANNQVGDYLKGLDAVKTELKGEISLCTNQSADLTNRLIDCTNNLAGCESEKFSLNSSLTFLLDSCKSDSLQLNRTLSDKIKSLEAQLDKKSEEFDSLVNNTARSNCCKAKIDNTNIKFYKVENNRVVCSEESGLELNCSL